MQLHGQIGFGAGIHQHPSGQGTGQRNQLLPVDAAGIEQQATHPLVDLPNPQRRRPAADERHIQKALHRTGRFPEAVAKLVHGVAPVLLGTDRRNFLVNIDALGQRGNILFRNVRLDLDIHQTFEVFHRLFALLLPDGIP